MVSTVPAPVPTLVSPRGGARVRAGTITLIVKDGSRRAAKEGVFGTLAPRRKLRKGALVSCTGGACASLRFVPYRGHPGLWIYKSGFSYPGYWSVTPGVYYWQAVRPGCPSGCDALSKIAAFRVVLS